MNERLLRERIRSLLLESTRGGMDAQVSVALWILQNNHGDHATVAPAGSTVPDVTIDGSIRLEVKSSSKGDQVSPFDLTVENKPDDPKAKDFQRVIDAIIDKAIELENITQDDVDRWDLNDNGIIEFSEYVAAVGGKYTPEVPETAPPRPFEYTVVDKAEAVVLQDTAGNVYKLPANASIKGKLSTGDTIKLSQEIDSSSGTGESNAFVMDIASMGQENKKTPGVWRDAEKKQISVWIELPDGSLRKQSTLMKSGNLVISNSSWRAAAGSKLKSTKQYEKFGKEPFASQVANNEQVMVSSEVMKEAAALWAHHLYEGGDNYIAVVSPNTIQMLGVLDDPLGLGVNVLSDIGGEAVESMYFGTYGTAGPNQMRAVPKLKLKTSIFTSVPRPTEADQEILDYGMVTNDQGAVLKSFTKGKGTFGKKGEMEKDTGKEIASAWDETQTSQAITAQTPQHVTPSRPPRYSEPTFSEVKLLRCLVREALLLEELTKSDKRDIERIARKQAKVHFDSSIDKVIDKALGTSFMGNKGKVNKFVEVEISKRFKAGDKDKEFASAVEKIAKRVLQALFDMHYKRTNLIQSMPVPKS